MLKAKFAHLFMFAVLVLFSTVGSELFAADYYMATNGSNSNLGTFAEPWTTLEYSLTQLSPGDTLYIRGGVYYEHAISTGLSGTAMAPITIQSYPGERAVLDGGVSYFKDAPNSEWELVNAGINLYKTVRTFSQGFATAWLMDYDVQIINYATSQTNFIESTNYTDASQPFYCGPGVQWRNDGRIYIRLQQNPTELTDPNGDPIDPVPADVNPNNNRIALAIRSGTSPYHDTIIDLVGASYLRFKDLDFVNSSYAMEWYNATHDIELDSCYIEHGYRGIEIDDDSAASYNGHIHHCEFNNGAPDWIYWTDVKNTAEGKPAYPEFQSTCIQGQMTGFNIHHNLFRNAFDGLMANGPMDNCLITDNIFINTRDDAINVYPTSRNTEIARNLIRHCFTGIGLMPGSGTKGQIYIHHNIIDVSKLQHVGRPGNYREDRYWFWGTGGIFAKHGSGDLTFWLKFYNNTCVARRCGRNSDMGPRRAVGNSEKYVFNNIFFAVNNVRLLADDLEVNGSHYDGDVFWQPEPNGQFFFYKFGAGASGGTDANYFSLAEFRANSGTDWEVNGLQINPGLDINAIDEHNYNTYEMWGLYYPTNLLVFTEGASYDGLSWPDTAGVDYRGAIPPANPNLDEIGNVDWDDLEIFVRHWLDADCIGPFEWCEGADLDRNGSVDAADYADFGSQWDP